MGASSPTEPGLRYVSSWAYASVRFKGTNEGSNADFTIGGFLCVNMVRYKACLLFLLRWNVLKGAEEGNDINESLPVMFPKGFGNPSLNFKIISLLKEREMRKGGSIRIQVTYGITNQYLVPLSDSRQFCPKDNIRV